MFISLADAHLRSEAVQGGDILHQHGRLQEVKAMSVEAAGTFLCLVSAVSFHRVLFLSHCIRHELCLRLDLVIVYCSVNPITSSYLVQILFSHPISLQNLIVFLWTLVCFLFSFWCWEGGHAHCTRIMNRFL